MSGIEKDIPRENRTDDQKEIQRDIQKEILRDDQKDAIDALDENSINSYPQLSLDGNTVEVLGLNFHKSSGQKNEVISSDFTIQSTIYKGKKPLVLPVKQGNDYTQLRYIQDNWEKQYHAPYYDRSTISD